MATNAPQQGHKGREVLSASELDLLSLLVRGKTNAEMAAALDVSERTVYSHIESIKHKLDLSSRADLLRFVRENGLK
jgi:DNA-binding CsgD family transcriptional regulator